jgi:hypothetical protein
MTIDVPNYVYVELFHIVPPNASFYGILPYSPLEKGSYEANFPLKTPNGFIQLRPVSPQTGNFFYGGLPAAVGGPP